MLPTMLIFLFRIENNTWVHIDMDFLLPGLVILLKHFSLFYIVKEFSLPLWIWQYLYTSWRATIQTSYNRTQLWHNLITKSLKCPKFSVWFYHFISDSHFRTQQTIACLKKYYHYSFFVVVANAPANFKNSLSNHTIYS